MNLRLPARLGLPMLSFALLLRLARRSQAFHGPPVVGAGRRCVGAGPIGTPFGLDIKSHQRRPGLTAVRAAAGRDHKPPEFTILEDEDDDFGARIRDHGASAKGPGRTGSGDRPPPDFSIEFDDDGVPVRAIPPERSDDDARGDRSWGRVKATTEPPRLGSSASWMDRNHAFTGKSADDDNDGGRTFREDFRGTRLFVQNLPPDATWQDVKDHFKRAGEVVFASISRGVDERTGEPKRCGIVQFETTTMAENAMAIMDKCPLDGYTLAVRPDRQEAREGARLKSAAPRGPTPPTKWKCADDGVSPLTEEEVTAVRMLIKQRDQARRRKDYEMSDEIREDLKVRYGVQIDDRLKMFWTSLDGRGVPGTIQDIKGDGRWGDPKPWRMIPTTPENDACVNPDLVNGLLKQRDIARREKDFATADALLAEARESPDGDLSLRIHDESRTWRIWTEERPSFGGAPRAPRKNPSEQCIDLVEEFAPERLEEVKSLLERFPGREYNILKKLKKQFNV